VFVSVGGKYDIILTSSDGVSWTNHDLSLSRNLFGVAYGNGTFVAVGDNEVATSPDGLAWTLRSLGDYGLGPVAYGAYGFVAPVAGYYQHQNWTYHDSSVVATSFDGITWVIRPIDSNTTSVGFGNGSYIFLCDPGTIRQNTPLQGRARPLLAGRHSGGGFELSMTAQPGYNYALERSATLASPVWTNVYTFASTQAVTKFLDSTATNHSVGFYRITAP
jgi:hypothetical protein